MTRKDYVLISEAIQDTRIAKKLPANDPVMKMLVEELSKRLARDNPQFDYSRFARACGQPSKGA